jgi:hypothetical protein
LNLRVIGIPILPNLSIGINIRLAIWSDNEEGRGGGGKQTIVPEYFEEDPKAKAQDTVALGTADFRNPLTLLNLTLRSDNQAIPFSSRVYFAGDCKVITSAKNVRDRGD